MVCCAVLCCAQLPKKTAGATGAATAQDTTMTPSPDEEVEEFVVSARVAAAMSWHGMEPCGTCCMGGDIARCMQPWLAGM